MFSGHSRKSLNRSQLRIVILVTGRVLESRRMNKKKTENLAHLSWKFIQCEQRVKVDPQEQWIWLIVNACQTSSQRSEISTRDSSHRIQSEWVRRSVGRVIKRNIEMQIFLAFFLSSHLSNNAIQRRAKNIKRSIILFWKLVAYNPFSSHFGCKKRIFAFFFNEISQVIY